MRSQTMQFGPECQSRLTDAHVHEPMQDPLCTSLNCKAEQSSRSMTHLRTASCLGQIIVTLTASLTNTLACTDKTIITSCSPFAQTHHQRPKPGP